jgi:repressor LexA
MEKIRKLKSFGNRLLECRKELGLSQTDLAKKIGLKTKESISKMELGYQNIDLLTVEKIAEILGVNKIWLGYGEGNKNG